MSGELLDNLLDEAMESRSYLITNSVMCTPFTDKGRSEITEPTKQQKLACSTWVQQLMVITEPTFVFTLGLHAYRTVNKIKVDFDYTLVKLAHPNAILMSKQRELDERKFVVTIREYLNAEEESTT